jgi:hypothetical protein
MYAQKFASRPNCPGAAEDDQNPFGAPKQRKSKYRSRRIVHLIDAEIAPAGVHCEQIIRNALP